MTFGFSNCSEDLHAIVGAVAAALGLKPRRNGVELRFARRADVAQLLERVGTKDTVPLAALRTRWSDALAA